jgi:D-threo-aldose 1-dehydrogenase
VTTLGATVLVRELGTTGLRTTALGFGCAGVFRLPRRADRLAALDVAYDAGIRHFDVAPIYGLGRAESELGQWARRKADDVVIATKFGIAPTAFGRLAGTLQGPVRSVLSVRPHLDQQLKSAGNGPTSGTVGRLLYSPSGYTPRSALIGLDRSLKALGAGHVDVFLLHDPSGDLRAAAPGLIAHLEQERERGRIRAWGIAGERFEADPGLSTLQDAAPVLQFRDDLFEPPGRMGDDPAQGRITFGAFGRALPALRQFLDRPDAPAQWSDRLGIDVTAPGALPALLLRDAVRRNPTGPVLFTSTQVGHIRDAVGAVERSVRASDVEEARGMDELVSALRLVHAQAGPAQ